LLGESMVLNNSLAYVKGRNPENLRLHCDSLMVPDPLPEYLHLANFTMTLTDYTLAGGCIGIVPGSHRYRRHPTAHEATDYSAMQPIECPAGTLIVIPGNTWHGAFPKSTDGLRVTLVQAFSRMYLAPSVSHDIDPHILERNPEAFRRLLGAHLWTGYDERGLDLEKFAPSYRTQRSHFA
ncbi:MAG: phytanoyl-CoA dioxygenase family protein, partial [Burkholderiales bacterium]